MDASGRPPHDAKDCALIREGGEVLERAGQVLVADAPAPGVGWP
ncbi:MAG TPA: hypothetical protein VNP73_00815 [Actinomycetota bacterium]|nr:hypothetical protein [Actinomycetota bacterium]